jgi:long-chain acyl-CoA synthetase
MSMNLATIVRQSAQAWPDRIALTLNEHRLTYAALHEAVQRMAGGLRDLGVAPGQNVALLLPNVPQFSITYFGALYAGCRVVPLNVLMTADEIAYHLADSDSVALVIWERFAPQAVEAMARVPSCKHLIVARPGGGAPAEPVPGAVEFSSLLGRGTPVRDLPDTMPDDTAVILYTSGTTGRPKGAELTHLNLFLNAHTYASHIVQLREDTVALACLPLFHIMGQVTVHHAVLHVGGEVVLLPRFEPRTAFELMQKHKVTLFVGVPTMYLALLHFPEASTFDLSALRTCGSGGASMPMETMRVFEERYRVSILEGYGLSETSPLTCFNGFPKPKKAGAIGLPIPGVEVRLEAPDGTVITKPNEPGEICIKGFNVMKGYYKKPDETRAAIRNGWLRSGDVGIVDEEGYFKIVDRLKDLIIRGGLNVYPREVEEVLYTHPAVAEAAVIGVPDPAQGEEVKAVIALKAGASATEQDIISYCRERVALYKFPRSVEFRDALPKGATGKIDKKKLK